MKQWNWRARRTLAELPKLEKNEDAYWTTKEHCSLNITRNSVNSLKTLTDLHKSSRPILNLGVCPEHIYGKSPTVASRWRLQSSKCHVQIIKKFQMQMLYQLIPNPSYVDSQSSHGRMTGSAWALFRVLLPSNCATIARAPSGSYCTSFVCLCSSPMLRVSSNAICR